MGLFDQIREEKVRVEKVGSTGFITINNPPQNTLDSQVFSGLKSGFGTLARDNEVQVIVFRSTGLVFSAGVDVKEIYKMVLGGVKTDVEERLDEFHKFLLFAIETSPKIIVAAIDGFCLGGGLELALACDYIVATPRSQFGFPEINLGLMPGLGGTQRTPRRIGIEKAVRLILSGKPITADIALSINLIDKITTDEFQKSLMGFVTNLSLARPPKNLKAIQYNPQDLSTDKFLGYAEGKPRVAVLNVLAAISEGAGYSLAPAIVAESSYFIETLFSPDAREGLEAYIQKRPPRFSVVVEAKTSGPPKKEEEVPKTAALIPIWETDDYGALRQAVREFCKKEIEPLIPWMEKNGEVPKALLKKMADLDFFSVSFPREHCGLQYGGLELGKIGACILADELTYCHPSTAVTLGAHASLTLEAIHSYGNEEQKLRYLIPGIRGEKIGAFAVTEPDVGSDVAALKTFAKKTDGGWILKGSKQFITNGEIADFIVVAAQTDHLGGKNTLALFILDTPAQGFEITKREEKTGLHASRTNSFALDSVFVPDQNLLGEVGQGFKMIMNIFNYSRITLAASCVGLIRRAIDEAINFSKNRVLFGEPLFMKQNTQMEIGKMEAIRFVAEGAVFNAAWMADRGLDVRYEAAMVKYFASELADQAVDMSLQLHGGAGYIKDSPIERFARDSRVFRLFEGTSEVQKLLVFSKFKSRFV